MELRPGYKQTEVGVIPEEWEVKNLGSLCKITTGHKDVNEGNPAGQFPFFTCSRSVTYSDSFSFDTEAILIAGNGDVGTRHYYKGKFEAYQRTYVLDRFRLNIRYVDQFLERGLIPSLSVDKIGSSIPYIKLGNLRDFPIAFPSNDNEVDAIAGALGDVDTLLGALTQIIAKKRDLKQAAMQQLLTGQTRLPGFSGAWEVKRLGEVTDVDPENLGSGTRPDYAFNYISLEDVDSGTLNSHSELTFRAAPSRARRRLRRGDVLVATVRPNLTSHYLFESDEEDWVCSTGFAVVRCRQRVTHPGYVFFHMFGDGVSRQIDALLTGSNYPAINSGDVRALELPFPEYDEQAAIAAVLSDMDAELAALEQRLAKTRALKQAMMQELLTGRTRLV